MLIKLGLELRTINFHIQPIMFFSRSEHSSSDEEDHSQAGKLLEQIFNLKKICLFWEQITSRTFIYYNLKIHRMILLLLPINPFHVILAFSAEALLSTDSL